MNEYQQEMLELVKIAISEYGIDNIADGVAQFGFTATTIRFQGGHEELVEIVIRGEVFGKQTSITIYPENYT